MMLDSELRVLRDLGPDGLAELKHRARKQLFDLDAGRLHMKWCPKPCTIKILMVADGFVSFNHYYFGLSELLDTLRTNPEYWVEFEVTRAHRQNDPNPPLPGTPESQLYGTHHTGFRLNDPAYLAQFHQVWFVGWNNGLNDNLSEDELENLYRWMNDTGGGVFAVGDHATLGEAMCAEIPRVRSMRGWRSADTPPGSGDDRHDTLVKGHDWAPTPVDESTQYTFDDESDDIPMKLRLKRYYGWSWAWPRWPRFIGRRSTWSPHPVLCGVDGPIDVFPDHPHEGVVVEPADLTDSPSFNGYSRREYPDLGSRPLAPEIVAWAKVQDDHTDTSDINKGFANEKEFGAVGAYDGHRVNVGRVVVDSTWHHWMDVNLTGRMEIWTDNTGGIETGDLRKERGFNDTTQGQATLDRIRNYFRNVAIWLSPPDQIQCMNNRALWGALYRYPLIEELHPKLPLLVLGKSARDALGRRAGQCQVRTYWYLPIEKFKIFERLDPKILPDPLPSGPLADLPDLVLGGIVKEMLEAMPRVQKTGEPPSDKELAALADRGALAGLKAVQANTREQVRAAEHVAGLLKEAEPKKPRAARETKSSKARPKKRTAK